MSRFDTTDARAVCPYNRYSSADSTTDAVTFDTTDAQIVRPYNRYSSRGSLLVAICDICGIYDERGVAYVQK